MWRSFILVVKAVYGIVEKYLLYPPPYPVTLDSVDIVYCIGIIYDKKAVKQYNNNTVLKRLQNRGIERFWGRWAKCYFAFDSFG